ncbi:hypothetical protein NJ76_30030, partial [Rhodococcus sp. IITR03]
MRSASVVSDGWHRSEPKMLSKPTTLTCSGTDTPRSRIRRSTPMASMSLWHTTAVAPAATAAR